MVSSSVTTAAFSTNVRRDLFHKVEDFGSGYVRAIACSDLVTPKVAKALVALYTDGLLKITVLKSIDVFSILVHVIITFIKSEDAVKYGISDDIPEIIHAAFLGERYVTGYVFKPLLALREKTFAHPDFVWIVVLQVPTANETINVIGTARTGADVTYWTGEPRSYDPKIPLVDQAAELFTEETISSGLWMLKNFTTTAELNPERTLVKA